MTEPVPSSVSPTRSLYPYGQEGGGSANLADILERVLDKGIVIVGDIKINLLDIELLTIKLRLLVASVDKAKEIGIDWWEHDPALSSRAHEPHELELREQNERLRAEVKRLRQRAGESPAGLPGGEAHPGGTSRTHRPDPDAGLDADAARARPAERPRRPSERARDGAPPRSAERARGGEPARGRRRARTEEDRGEERG
ncbi:gas vesicle protein [Streptomyces roseifaciens]